MNKETTQIKNKTVKELFRTLYRLEDYLEYNKTEQGEILGELINKLQKELLTQTK